MTILSKKNMSEMIYKPFIDIVATLFTCLDYLISLDKPNNIPILISHGGLPLSTYTLPGLFCEFQIFVINSFCVGFFLQLLNEPMLNICDTA